MSRTNIHATGLVLGTTGVILRGPSGAGKSLLALSLIEAWEARVRGDMELKQAVTMAAEAGRKYINVASESLGG